jgi:CelD/BcsL family acetyltransferase involved in cellulose biosynthesis
LKVAWEEGIPGVAREWDELADRVDAGPFVRPGWFEAWMGAFEDRREPSVLTARRDGDLVAAVPLFIRRGVVASPTNWHTPKFGAVAVDGEAAREVARELVARASTRLDLSFLNLEQPFAKGCLEAARVAGRRVICRPVLRSPYVELRADFEAYEATLKTKARREMTRRRRRLEEQGSLTFDFSDGRQDLEARLAEGFAVEGSGWKVDRGTAIASDSGTAAFYSKVASWAADRGWLELGYLRLEGRALAFAYLIVVGGVVHVLKIGFDPEYRRYAPGSLLTRATIQRAYERGMSRYDFLGAEDPYKLDWTQDVRERVRLQAFGSTPAGTGGYIAWRYARPAAKRALSSLRRGE